MLSDVVGGAFVGDVVGDVVGELLDASLGDGVGAGVRLYRQVMEQDYQVGPGVGALDGAGVGETAGAGAGTLDAVGSRLSVGSVTGESVNNILNIYSYSFI